MTTTNTKYDHRFFRIERGVLTLSDDLNVMVSESANGTKGFQEWVIAFHGKPIRSPQRPNYYPERAAVTWHVREVFQGPARCKTFG